VGLVVASAHPGSHDRPALNILACPECHGILTPASHAETDEHFFPACQLHYPVIGGIPHFIQSQALTGLNKRFAQIYDWASWGYRLFSRTAFVYIGMSEEQGRSADFSKGEDLILAEQDQEHPY